MNERAEPGHGLCEPIPVGARAARGRLYLVPLALLVGASLGCGNDRFSVGKTVPVAGTVTVSGQPLHLDRRAFGKVWYYPDAAKGNGTPQVAFGTIDAEGNYRLFTRGREGAAPGWYRVMVVATEQSDPSRPSRPRRCFVSTRYGALETSGLSVQVVEEPAPGAYDLHLTR